MKQLVRDIRARRPLFASVRGWWGREAWGVLLGAFFALALWSGYLQTQVSRSAREAAASARISAMTANGNCEGLKVSTTITADILAEQSASSRLLLPHLNSFAGLTHRQLVALTEQRERVERRHLGELLKVRNRSCPSAP